LARRWGGPQACSVRAADSASPCSLRRPGPGPPQPPPLMAAADGRSLRSPAAARRFAPITACAALQRGEYPPLHLPATRSALRLRRSLALTAVRGCKVRSNGALRERLSARAAQRQSFIPDSAGDESCR
jgi:hypothetical protein